MTDAAVSTPVRQGWDSVFCVSEPIVRRTILVHEIGLLEQLYEPLGRSLRLELSVVPSQKLLDLLPNGAAQFYCFRTGLPPYDGNGGTYALVPISAEDLCR
jgi:hypothetical protein